MIIKKTTTFYRLCQLANLPTLFCSPGIARTLVSSANLLLPVCPNSFQHSFHLIPKYCQCYLCPFCREYYSWVRWQIIPQLICTDMDLDISLTLTDVYFEHALVVTSMLPWNPDYMLTDKSQWLQPTILDSSILLVP